MAILSDYLAANGIELFIVEIAGDGSPYSFEKRSQSLADNWVILFPESKMEDLNPLKISHSINKYFDKINPDVLISGPIAYPSGAIASNWSRKNKKPLIIFDDARLQDVIRPLFINFIKKLIYKNAQAIFCPAPSHLPTFEYFGFDKTQIFYGLNAIDNSWFIEKTKKLKTQKKEKILLGIGRQIPKKNWITLVNTFISYKNLYPESILKLVLIGDGPDHKELVKKAGGQSDIIFHPFMQQEEICSFYANATALVLPSFGETWGLVVNEAMACELPVLVSNECGCAETLVEDGVNGWLLDPHDPGDILDAIHKLDELTQDELNRMGKSSSAIINQWGLNQFCEGLYESIKYVLSIERTKPGIMSGIATLLWKGRYRPV